MEKKEAIKNRLKQIGHPIPNADETPKKKKYSDNHHLIELLKPKNGEVLSISSAIGRENYF
jgi:hypothetical protein